MSTALKTIDIPACKTCKHYAYDDNCYRLGIGEVFVDKHLCNHPTVTTSPLLQATLKYDYLNGVVSLPTCQHARTLGPCEHNGVLWAGKHEYEWEVFDPETEHVYVACTTEDGAVVMSGRWVGSQIRRVEK